MTKIAIFDLDGTLLNTIADLADATNYALAEHGFPVHPVASYYYFVGNGINMLFKRALPEEARDEETIAAIRASFKVYYKEHGEDHTVPYDGIRELLETLQQRGVMLGVASNKYHEATVDLVNRYFPTIRFAAVYGQREGIPVKPHPRVIEDILRETQTNTSDVLYIGDSDVDMMTAKAAGVKGVGVCWGFRPKEELMQHQPYALVETPEEILNLLKEEIH